MAGLGAFKLKADQLFIGVDSGTQGVKTVVLSRKKKKVIADAYASHDLIETPAGGREQKPEWWVRAMEKTIRQVLGAASVKPHQVKAIAVSGQQHGLVPLDHDGEVIRPAKLWCDTETAPQCDMLTKRVGGQAAVIAAIGNQISAGFTAPKLLWMKEKEPQNFKRLHTILLPHDFLNFHLSGECKMEFGDASGTAFFDIRNRCWSQTLLRAIDAEQDLETFLPELIEADAPCGRLRPELADDWGLPHGVLVAAGGGDNMMAAIGTGNVLEGPITASLGTSGTIYAFSKTPVTDPQGELAGFCSSSGGWLPLVCTMNVTVATEQIRNLLGLDLEEFNGAVAEADPGAGGLLLLPYFNGERTPDLPLATASLTGMTPLNFTRENLARAAMEGATLGLRYGLSVMTRCGVQKDEIRLVGGGAKSPVWRQMVADMFDVPVVTMVEKEAAALGAALQAMWCHLSQAEGKSDIAQICADYVKADKDTQTKPDARTAAIYKDLYVRYLENDKVLRPLARLNRL